MTIYTKKMEREWGERNKRKWKDIEDKLSKKIEIEIWQRQR